MDKICGWSEREIKELLTHLKGATCSRKQVFKDYAGLTGRSPESVRNFYYMFMKQIKDNQDNRFGALNRVNTGKAFSKKETEALVSRVVCGLAAGKSVRKVCEELANNNLKETTRLQNKYRNTINKDPSIIARITLKPKAEGEDIKHMSARINTGKVNNIITMPKQESSRLTDGEIKSLFLGLVRLVKRSAAEEVALELRRECEFANSTLRNTLIDLRRKDRVLEELKEQNTKLTTQVVSLGETLAKVRSENLNFKIKVEKYVESKKMDKLKLFLSGLKNVADRQTPAEVE